MCQVFSTVSVQLWYIKFTLQPNLAQHSPAQPSTAQHSPARQTITSPSNYICYNYNDKISHGPYASTALSDRDHIDVCSPTVQYAPPECDNRLLNSANDVMHGNIAVPNYLRSSWICTEWDIKNQAVEIWGMKNVKQTWVWMICMYHCTDACIELTMIHTEVQKCNRDQQDSKSYSVSNKDT